MAGTGMTTYSVNENGHELFISVCGIPSDLYAYQTRYVASIVAYGNLECWTRTPEKVLPGKLGDYQSGNITEAERAEYDPLFLPGDKVIEYEDLADPEAPEEAVPEETEAEETGEVDLSISVSDDPDKPSPKAKKKYPKIVNWVLDNLIIAAVVAGLVLIIVILLIVILVRLTGSNKRKKKSKNRIRRPYIGEVIREMPDAKDLKNK